MKNKKNISYPNIQSAIRPIPHGPGVPIPSPPDSLDDILDDHETLAQQGDSEEDSGCYDPSTTDSIPFSQYELNDLARDLGLPKDSAEVLGSRLKDKNMLAPGTSFSWYRSREKELYLSSLKNVTWYFAVMFLDLWHVLKIEYAPYEWRLGCIKRPKVFNILVPILKSFLLSQNGII